MSSISFIQLLHFPSTWSITCQEFLSSLLMFVILSSADLNICVKWEVISSTITSSRSKSWWNDGSKKSKTVWCEQPQQHKLTTTPAWNGSYLPNNTTILQCSWYWWWWFIVKTSINVNDTIIKPEFCILIKWILENINLEDAANNSTYHSSTFYSDIH